MCEEPSVEALKERIQKPFNLHELSRKIREIPDAK